MGSSASCLATLTTLTTNVATIPTRLSQFSATVAEHEKNITPVDARLPPTSSDPTAIDNLCAGSSIFLSELCAEFPAGQQAFNALQVLYVIWNSAETRKKWTAHFMVYLRSVERDLILAGKSKINEEPLNRLSEKVANMREELEIILHRNSFMAIVFAAQDAAYLESQRAAIENLKDQALNATTVAIAVDMDKTSEILATMQAELKKNSEQQSYWTDRSDRIRENEQKSDPNPHHYIRIIDDATREEALKEEANKPAVNAAKEKADALKKAEEELDKDIQKRNDAVTQFKLLHGTTLQVNILSLRSAAKLIKPFIDLNDFAGQLDDSYALWNNAQNRTVWLADFFVQVQSAEILVSSNPEKVFRKKQYIEPVAASLKEWKSKLQEIAGRSNWQSMIHSSDDKVTLEGFCATLTALQKNALFSHFTDLKSEAKKNIKDLDALRDALSAQIESQERTFMESQNVIKQEKEDAEMLARLLLPIDQEYEMQREREKYSIGSRLKLIQQIGNWLYGRDALSRSEIVAKKLLKKIRPLNIVNDKTCHTDSVLQSFDEYKVPIDDPHLMEEWELLLKYLKVQQEQISPDVPLQGPNDAVLEISLLISAMWILVIQYDPHASPTRIKEITDRCIALDKQNVPILYDYVKQRQEEKFSIGVEANANASAEGQKSPNGPPPTVERPLPAAAGAAIGTGHRSNAPVSDVIPPPKGDSRVFWLSGELGVGKTTLASILVESFPKQILAAHFCKHDQELRKSPTRALKSLAWQLSAQFKPYRDVLLQRMQSMASFLPSATPAELWDLLLVQPLAHVEAQENLNADMSKEISGANEKDKNAASNASKGRQKVVLLIDGIDECTESRAGSSAPTNPLLTLLASELNKLPKWIGFILTSREDKEVSRSLARYGNVKMDREAQPNKNDVRTYLSIGVKKLFRFGEEPTATESKEEEQKQSSDKAGTKTKPKPNRVRSPESDALELQRIEDCTNLLVKKCDGLFLYASLMLENLAAIREDKEANYVATKSARGGDRSAVEAEVLKDDAMDRALSLDIEDFTNLPMGLDGFYLDEFQRIDKRLMSKKGLEKLHPWLAAWNKSIQLSEYAVTDTPDAESSKSGFDFVRGVFEICLASFEPLSLESLAAFFHTDTTSLLELLEPLCSGALFRLIDQQEINLKERAEFVRNSSGGNDDGEDAKEDVKVAFQRNVSALSRDDESDAEEDAVNTSMTKERYVPRTSRCFSVFHKSVKDWMIDPRRQESDTEQRFYIKVQRGHEKLREACLRELLVQQMSHKPLWQEAAGVITGKFGKILQAQALESSPTAAEAGRVPRNAIADLVSAKLWPTPPAFRMDEMAHPDKWLPPSSFLNYALRFGPRHCLAASSELSNMLSDADSMLSRSMTFVRTTSSTFDRSSTSLGAPQPPAPLPTYGSVAFQSQCPFLPAAQFLCHLGYVHARAAQGDLANLALEYAAAEESATEWEKRVQLLAEAATAANQPVPVSVPPAVSVPATSSSSSTLHTFTSGDNWLWIRDGARAAEALRSFRALVSLDIGEFRGVNFLWELSDKTLLRTNVDPSYANQQQRSFVPDEKKLTEEDDDEEIDTGYVDTDCYQEALQHIFTFRCHSIAAQFVHALASSFPRESPVEILGATAFQHWFKSWSGRRIHCVRWENKPNTLPNLLATLNHSASAMMQTTIVENNGDNENSSRVASTGSSAAVGSYSGSGSIKIHALAYSPDATRIASTCSLDRCIRVFHAVSYEILQLLVPTYPNSVVSNSLTPNHLMWLHDSARLACGGYRSPLQIFNAITGEPAIPIDNPIGNSSTGVQYSLFTQNDAFVFLVGFTNNIILYHVDSQTELRTFGSDVHQSRISKLATNSDGTLLYSCGWDEYVVVWELDSLAVQDEAALEWKVAKEASARSWANSIHPLTILVPPMSVGFSNVRNQIGSQPLMMNHIAPHPTDPNILVTVSSDEHGNGLCLWNLGLPSEHSDSPRIPSENPLRAIIQKPEQKHEQFTLAKFTPSGGHLFVASEQSTILSIFRVRALYGDEDAALATSGLLSPSQKRLGPILDIEIEFIAVSDVGNIGSDITCMDFSCPKTRRVPIGGATAKKSQTLPKRATTRGKWVQNSTAPDVFLLTGDTDGSARVWNVESLLSKARPELHPLTPRGASDSGMPLRGFKEEQKIQQKELDVEEKKAALLNVATEIAESKEDESDGEDCDETNGGGIFPRIAALTANEKYIVLADLKAVLHVYSTKNGHFLRNIHDEAMLTVVSTDKAAELNQDANQVQNDFVAAMVLGSASSKNDPDLLVVSYHHSRGIKLFNAAKGIFLRTIGSATASANLKCLVFNPNPQATYEARIRAPLTLDRAGTTEYGFSSSSSAILEASPQRPHTNGPRDAKGRPLIPQIFTSDACYVNMFDAVDPALSNAVYAEAGVSKDIVRTVFLAPPKANASIVAAEDKQNTQHASPIVAIDVHPSMLRLVTVDATGYVKMWIAYEGSDQELDKLNQLPEKVRWEKRARILWTYHIRRSAASRAKASLQAFSMGALEEVVLTIAKFSPNGAFLSVGGLNHTLSIFDARSDAAESPKLQIPQGDTVTFAWHPSNRFIATVDRRDTISIWDIQNLSGNKSPLLVQYLNQSPLSAGLKPMSRVTLAHGASSGFASGIATTAFVSFPFPHQMLFYSDKLNCVKVWEIEWFDRKDNQGAVVSQAKSVIADSHNVSTTDAASVSDDPSHASGVPLSTPIFFHCDRLISSTQPSLIHFFKVD